MRRVIFATTLILLPGLANAQAGTATESKQYPTSAGFLAELNKPAGLAEVAMAAATLETAMPEAKTAAVAGSINSEAVAGHAALREFVQTRVTDNFTEAALRQAGTLEFSMKATPVESSAPLVTRAVEVDLTPAEAAETPAIVCTRRRASIKSALSGIRR